MFSKLVISAILSYSIAGAAQTVACSNLSLGTNGALNGFVPSPSDAWHQDISNAPLDPLSPTIITNAADLGGVHLHADFSSIAAGGYGIPYTVVDSQSTPSIVLPVTHYAAESDVTLVPIPAVLPVESATGECPTDTTDRHAIIIDRNQCVEYELYQAAHCTAGWSAADLTLWDFTTTEKRPYSYTSTDAAGLSVFEGLIRYDEIVAGVINHAIRFTAKHTKTGAQGGYFTAPATHAAGNLWGTDNIIGMRIRLRANFDISGFSTTNKIILTAMKKYGMILADNGSSMFFQGTPDSRWNDSDLSKLAAIYSSAFEVVQMGPVYTNSSAPKGAAPVIVSFTASSTSIPSGGSVTLTPTVTGASYSYIDKAGFTRGPITVTPSVTTTYTLTSRNEFGTKSASVTVVVTGSQSTPTLAFTAIPSKTFGVAPFAVSASSQSAGTIGYSVTSGPATVSGNTLTVTGIGTVVVTATQAAAGSYSAASATTSFTVAAASPGLAFVPVSTLPYSTTPVTLSSTTASSGSIGYSVVSGPATVSGNKVTLTGAGTVSLRADQAASGNYLAGVVTTSFTVTAGTPSLAFTPVGSMAYGVAPFSVSAASQSTGAISYTVTSGPATVSGNLVTVTGVGTVSLKASQAATANYASALATTSFTVTPAIPGLAFVPILPKILGITPFIVSATSQSTGSISYAVTSGPAILVGNLVTILGTGSVALQATQAAAGNYASATATTVFAVTATSTALVLAAIPDQTYGNPRIALRATSPSPAPITYSIIAGSALISGNTLTLYKIGAVTVQAHQVASGTYPAASASASFNVAPEVVSLTFRAIPVKSFSTPVPFEVKATSISTGLMSYSVVSGPATLSGAHVTLTGPGIVTILATQAAAGNYAVSTGTISFTVNP